MGALCNLALTKQHFFSLLWIESFCHKVSLRKRKFIASSKFENHWSDHPEGPF